LPGARLVALPLLMTLGAVNFIWQLGSSSYYVDEVQSVNVSQHALGTFFSALTHMEVSPPAYYLFLHEWLYRFGFGHEWIARLPSALAGTALVGVVYWLCSLVSERLSTRLIAAALAALSPFVLQYAQLAQPYVFVALASAIAVGATVQALRNHHARGARLAVALVCSVLALCLHYTAAVITAPLCVWIATRSSLPRAWRAAFPLVALATGAALLPLVLAQHRSVGSRPGTAHSGAVNLTSVVSMFEVPFTGRVDALRVLGAIVTVLSCAVVALAVCRGNAARELVGSRSGRLTREGARALMPVLALGVPLVLLVFSALVERGFLGHLMLPRYAAIGAPFTIVTVALAFELTPRPVGSALLACAAIVIALGLRDSHRPTGFYADARGVAHYLRPLLTPGESVLATTDTVVQIPLLWYGAVPSAETIPPTTVLRLDRRPTWLIDESGAYVPSHAMLLADEREELKPLGLRPLLARAFPGIPTLEAVLVAPLRSGIPRRRRIATARRPTIRLT
jgi:4-amino-4-deoxy-L-arabinose transferase-like glycosyltransferase